LADLGGEPCFDPEREGEAERGGEREDERGGVWLADLGGEPLPTAESTGEPERDLGGDLSFSSSSSACAPTASGSAGSGGSAESSGERSSPPAAQRFNRWIF